MKRNISISLVFLFLPVLIFSESGPLAGTSFRLDISSTVSLTGLGMEMISEYLNGYSESMEFKLDDDGNGRMNYIIDGELLQSESFIYRFIDTTAPRPELNFRVDFDGSTNNISVYDSYYIFPLDSFNIICIPFTIKGSIEQVVLFAMNSDVPEQLEFMMTGNMEWLQ